MLRQAAKRCVATTTRRAANSTHYKIPLYTEATRRCTLHTQTGSDKAQSPPLLSAAAKGGLADPGKAGRQYSSRYHDTDARLWKPIDMLVDAGERRSLDDAWAAYVRLSELEGVVGREEILRQLHSELSEETLRRILRGITPAFGAREERMEAAATAVYRYAKLVNYLVLVSRLRKAERNRLIVLRLAMGQCVRRMLAAEMVQNSEGAQAVVRVWEQISAAGPRALRLELYDIRLLLLGTWKARRHALVPLVYGMACRRWTVAAGREFQKISAIALSFHVREQGAAASAAVAEILEDLNRRLLRMTPSHSSALILFFGRRGRVDEALRVLGQALEDADARTTEAIYYTTFRALREAYMAGGAKWADEPAGTGAGEGEGDGAGEDADGADGLAFVDEVDADLQQQQQPGEREAERQRVARTCTALFQTMADRGVRAGAQTYRELALCLEALDMHDKAQSVLAFAVESLGAENIPSGLVAQYLQAGSRSPYEMRLALRRALENVPGLRDAVAGFSERARHDRLGLYDGDVDALVERRPRTRVDERAGAFLARTISSINSAARAAAFFRCLLAGTDPDGRFAGFNFPSLGAGARGLPIVEAELAVACNVVAARHPAWLASRDMLLTLLPALPATTPHTDEPAPVARLRQLAASVDVDAFVGALHAARVEGCDVALVNQFLRVRVLGLTFQRYVQRKAGGARLFWPSFLHTQSGGWATLDADASHASTAAAPANARAWWEQIAAHMVAGHALCPDADTVAIFAQLAVARRDWALGASVWDRVLHTDADALPLRRGVRVYKHYVRYAAARAAASAEGAHALGDATLAAMFAAMDRAGASATAGLVGQAVRAALELGHVEIAAVLERWQRHRELSGLAQDGALRRWLGMHALPEVPVQAASVTALVRARGCPLLGGYVARQMQLQMHSGASAADIAE